MNSVYWALLASLIWGIVPLMEKAGLSKINPYPGLFYRSLGVMVGMLVLGMFVLKPQQIRQVDWRCACLLMAGGFLASFVGQIFFYNGLKSGDVSRIVAIAGSYPLISFIAGVAFLGEALTPLKVTGAGLVIAGIWALKTG